jgi:hypothetical protein
MRSETLSKTRVFSLFVWCAWIFACGQHFRKLDDGVVSIRHAR